MTDTSKTDVLNSVFNELSKEYILLDGVDRPWKIYQAPTDAIDGAPCIMVEYVYKNPSSSVVIKRKESRAEWDSTWDV